MAGVPIVETVGTFETVREGIHERRRSRGGVPLFNQVGGPLSALLALPPAALPTQGILGSNLTLIKVALVVFPVYRRRENRFNLTSNCVDIVSLEAETRWNQSSENACLKSMHDNLKTKRP